MINRQIAQQRFRADAWKPTRRSKQTLGSDGEESRMSVLDRLLEAVQVKDDEKLRLAVADVFWTRPTEDVVPLLSAVLLEHWHEQHEDIAHSLQQRKDPRAIDALAASLGVKFEHLERWGNEDAFRRKVTWALADIGGPRAKQILAEVLKSSDEQLAEYARKRLDAWESELHRKCLKTR